MSDNQGGNLQLSQGYEVLPPKTGKAYPVLCEEWDYLKDKIKKITDQPWLYQTVGSVFLGAALSTFISILVGTFPDESKSRAIVIAWAVFSVTLILGFVCLFFAHKERSIKQIQVSDVVTQMDIIEKRYEREVV